MPIVTPTLQQRATSTESSSSSSSSDACSGKNASSSQCEKPASETGLEIGLGVGVPIAVILMVLGVFMYRNYRKERKEAMDHDPDFDENGEATALPDFPAFTKEDPFNDAVPVSRVANNGGYPLMSLQNKSASELRSISTRGAGEKEYVDGFVLPYQHQLSSKTTLDEFARRLVDYKDFGQNGLPDLSRPHSRSPSVQLQNTRVSPQKSTTLRHVQQTSPVKTRKDYTNLPNGLNPLLNAEEFYNTKERFDESADTSKSSRSQEGFGVEYENELSHAINTTLPSENPVPYVAQTYSKDESDIESVEDSDEEPDHRDIPNSSHATTTADVLSPFGDKNRVPDSIEQKAPAVRVDGDFDFSNDSMDLGDRSDANLSVGAMKEPRMSAFNMLQNVSDDEDGESPSVQPDMTEEQQEELARMKSVYKVYFDRANSMKSVQDDGAGGRSFQVDPAQPLPTFDIDNLKINSELKGDTSYDKRKTTTSSIYEQAPIFDGGENSVVHPYQQFNAAPQQYQQYSGSPQQYQPQYAQPQSPKENLQPLKSLPNASDIRHSTIETFTDYQRRAKLSSPSLKQGNFDDSIGSPYMSSQASFPSPQGTPDLRELPPTLRTNSNGTSVPSPSQLARTSVVMLNPVSEITTLRKFKPAGSLPSGMAGPNQAYMNDELASSGDDLIPGNRKSAVRRMMNSNF